MCRCEKSKRIQHYEKENPCQNPSKISPGALFPLLESLLENRCQKEPRKARFRAAPNLKILLPVSTPDHFSAFRAEPKKLQKYISRASLWDPNFPDVGNNCAQNCCETVLQKHFKKHALRNRKKMKMTSQMGTKKSDRQLDFCSFLGSVSAVLQKRVPVSEKVSLNPLPDSIFQELHAATAQKIGPQTNPLCSKLVAGGVSPKGGSI